jgi:hypothetical protein
VGPRAGLDEVVKRKIPSPLHSAIPLSYPGSSGRWKSFEKHAGFVKATSVCKTRILRPHNFWHFSFDID